MKLFFAIIGVILIISFGLIMYLYQNITYQPEHITQMEEVDLFYNENGTENTYERVKAELKEQNSSFIDSEDLKNLIKYEINRENDKSSAEAVKKLNCEISGNVIKVEAVVDIRGLANLKFSKDIQNLITLVSSNLPGADKLGEIYIAVEGEPYNNNGQIEFKNAPVLYVGDFQHKIDLHDTDNGLSLEQIKLDDFKVSDFKMRDEKIQIFF